ncbi:MAG: radical SAM protein, partial [Bacteroidales bacterium]|nr:radical SAM protein [Bacteroidales bacterium]
MKFIHLLYVPTLACDMACRYCYLEDNTKDRMQQYKPLETLQFAINKLRESDVMPFNISLHGGEVSTLSQDDFHDVIKFINDYYKDNYETISTAGFRVGRPHIKTNLYSIDRHIDTIKKFNVSISGSLDLPLSLHNHFRVTKGGRITLDKILQNVELLRDIPN